jgi:hypothetical protein
MIEEITGPEAYLIYVWIKDVHPLLWRRFLVRSDSTLAELHEVFQIGFGWTDFHLHCFRIRKKDYAVPRLCGTSAHDARRVRLADFNFRRNERFIYEYDFGDLWQHQVRIEKRLPIDAKLTYPICIAGQWAGPPEDCGGPVAFVERRGHAPWRVLELIHEVSDELAAGEAESLADLLEELQDWREWLALDRFDRRAVNRQMGQMATTSSGERGLS